MATATGLLALVCLAVSVYLLLVGVPHLGLIPPGTIPLRLIPMPLLAIALSAPDASRPVSRSPFAPQMASCPNSCVTMSRHTDDGAAVRIWPGMCKSWDCPHCGPIKAGRWNNAVGRAIRRRANEDGRPRARHIVLTVSARRHSLDEAWAIAQTAKTEFMEDMQERYGPLRYVWVLARQDNGYPHIHIIVMGGRFMPQKQLRAGWGKRGGGHVWVHLAYDLPGLVRYLAGQLPGVLPEVVKRRWSTSRGRNPVLYEPFESRAGPARPKATLHMKSPKAVAREYERQGMKVILKE